MIDKIGINYIAKQPIKHTKSSETTSPQTRETATENPISSPKLSSELLSQYFVSFKGKGSSKTNSSKKAEKRNQSSYEVKVEDINNNATPKAEDILIRATEYAKETRSKEITQLHVLKIILDDTLEEIDALDEGERFYSDESELESLECFEEKFGRNIFKKPEIRKLIRPIIEEEISHLDTELRAKGGELKANATPQLAKDFANDICSVYTKENMPDSPDPFVQSAASYVAELDRADGLVHDSTILAAILDPHNIKIKQQYITPFTTKLKDTNFIDATPLEERIQLSFYEDKARNIWKNLAVGTNMLVLHDTHVNPQYLVNSFLGAIHKPDAKFGHLTQNNTEITVLKHNKDIDYMTTKMRYAAKDKSKTHVFVIDITTKDLKVLALTGESIKYFEELPSNVKFVMVADKDIYYNQGSSEKVAKFLNDFGEVHVPIMNVTEAKKAFRDEPRLMSKVKKEFSAPAMAKVIEACAQLQGDYPEKAQRIFERISAYYIDKEKISLKDVLDYIKEAKEVFKDQENDSTLKVILDTGIKLKDLVGTPSAAKEAKSIVRRINNKTIGTRGCIIFSQDGSVGSGRKHTAKAIAGETKSPYIEINAVDFGTKDIDLFGMGNLSPEKSIKKLFGLVKSQADTTPHRSAVIFIEKFDHFASDDFASDHQEKAMSQLIREMESAQKQGYNILVIGSSELPDWLGAETAKSGKFIDTIEVDSPIYNNGARKEIIEHYIKKKSIKLNANTPESRREIINHIAATASRMTYLQILTLLDKAKTVAQERNHKSIEKSDFTEAFLRITCGRPNEAFKHPHKKAITTSHECGHATNTIVMHRLMKSLNKPWTLPDSINFITLDPRSVFGGSLYTQNPDNENYTFETMFATEVTMFGGHSAEKHFFGIDGSWGPTGDFKYGTKIATEAVAICGMGKRFGKKSLNGMAYLSVRDQNHIDKDIDVILKNALAVSDLITKTYEEFNREFTARYKGKYGTGDCIISSETFEQEFNDWIARQPEDVKQEIEKTNDTIIKIIEKTKEGIIY